jgi:hypothetical protein
MQVLDPNAGVESVQTNKVQALNLFKLIQRRHWITLSKANAGIENA